MSCISHVQNNMISVHDEICSCPLWEEIGDEIEIHDGIGHLYLRDPKRAMTNFYFTCYNYMEKL